MACSGAILWALSGRRVWPLTVTPIPYLGRISYSLYLIHSVMLIEIGRHLHGRVMLPIVAAAAALLYASCSWHFLEKPILRGRAVPATPLATVAAAD
jgi:peptidoglycan/LPS O-acetylase OafA/YrhL